MRVTKTREAEHRRRNKGLGGFLRNVQLNTHTSAATPSKKSDDDDDSDRASLLSQYSSAAPAAAPADAPAAAKGSTAAVDGLLKKGGAAAKAPAAKKKGYLFERLEEGVSDYEAVLGAKRQKINEVRQRTP